MNSLAIFVAAATLGVDYGWQNMPNGQLEYLIQIEPALVPSLQAGAVSITSELPPEVRGVRRFKITVGNQRLPREAIVQASAQEPARSNEGSVLVKPPTGKSIADKPPIDKAGLDKTGLDKPRVPDNFAQSPYLNAPRSQYGGDANPVRPGPLEHEERDRFAANSGRAYEQAAAKPTDANVNEGASAESPSSEMSRQTDEKSTINASVAETGDDDGSNSPWLVGSIVALCASLGANFYQGWNLKTARRRYYQLVDRLGLRTMPGSDGVSIEGYAK